MMRERLLWALLLVWTTTSAYHRKEVYVNTTSVEKAVRAVRQGCRKAHVISVTRTEFLGEPAMLVHYTGTCDVPVAGA